MIKLSQVIVVEGRYDKNKVRQLFDATVIDTGGFGVFKDREKLALLRRMAEQRGLVILTDADGGGLVIRSFLKSAVQVGRIWHAYIPPIPGKERRKAQGGKAGLLGVEGVPDQVIIEAVRRSGALDDQPPQRSGEPITKADLYALGLSGGDGSRARRVDLCKRLDLPQNISATSLLEVLNILYTRESLAELIKTVSADAEA